MYFIREPFKIRLILFIIFLFCPQMAEAGHPGLSAGQPDWAGGPGGGHRPGLLPLPHCGWVSPVSLSCTSLLCSELRVMSLNTWGMPHTLGSEDKELRMAAIGRYINQSEHDVYLLEELWMRPDYATIARHVPEGWFITDYSAMTNGGCDGVAAPDGCSGLAVVSRFPFIEVSRRESCLTHFVNRVVL